MAFDSGRMEVMDVRELDGEEVDMVSGGIEPVTTTVVVVIVVVAVVVVAAVFAIGAVAGYFANN